MTLLLKFNDIWPFDPSPGVARPIHESNSHTKFGWISSNGLGGDSITDRRTDENTQILAILLLETLFIKIEDQKLQTLQL